MIMSNPQLANTAAFTATALTAAAAPTNKLASLKAQGLKAFATKDYASSADFFAQACEIQSSQQGEDNPKNAYLLYLYGRALFHLAQAKSDVLGPATSTEEKPKLVQSLPAVAEETEENAADGHAKAASASNPDKLKPKFFSFTGDENWDDASDVEDGDDKDQNSAEEEFEEDEMNAAWEILDLARVLFEKQLCAVSPGMSSATNESATNTKAAKTALADVYDLLGEVSLESESFEQAVKDLTATLKLREELYDTANTLLAEGHYKLSLALEFAAASENVSAEERDCMRASAAEHVEKAIESCGARIAAEETKLGDDDTKGKSKESKASKEIANVKEMVSELEQRLQDLRAPPVEVAQDETALGGLLGQLLGDDPVGAKKKLETAIQSANDVTGLVRKKRQPKAEAMRAPSSGAPPKRKLEEDNASDEGSKKAKLEDAVDAAPS